MRIFVFELTQEPLKSQLTQKQIDDLAPHIEPDEKLLLERALHEVTTRVDPGGQALLNKFKSFAAA